MRVAVLLLCFLMVAGPAPASAQTSGTSQLGGIALTPEQQMIFDALPPEQRQQILDQVRAFEGTLPPPGEVGADVAGAAPVPTEERASTPQLSPDVIRPDDTLVVDILFPEASEVTDSLPAIEAPASARRRHLLRGRHVVQLDRFGRLTLPGVRQIPLAGLNAEQAELRLMAEHALADMAVFVTRLPLMKTGRDALEPFGYNIFRRPVDRLDALRGIGSLGRSGVSVPADYLVGPGDTIQLFLYGQNSGRHYLQVTSDGLLEMPELGPVAVAGMTFSAAKQIIERRVREETIGTQASVSMGALRSIEVFVVGEVTRPGLHQISSLSTVVNALYQAEGISEIGTLRDIRVFRAGQQVEQLDLYELLLSGNPRGDVRLQNGDVVFVPVTGSRAGVFGEVMRPAYYELDDDTDLGDLLDFAGGTAVEGDLRNVQIERRGPAGRLQYVDVDATTGAGRATPIDGHDYVIVSRISPTAENAVALHGHFEQPGLRAWRDGMRLADFVTDTMLKQDPDLDYGILIRHLGDGRGLRAIMFSPGAVLSGEPGASPTLERRDEIYIFGMDDTVTRRALVDPLVERLRRQATGDDRAQVVQVTGAVRAPGQYPLSEGMLLSDLVHAGGGLTESAFHDTAEITRFETRNGVRREIEHIEVQLGRMLRDATADIPVQAHDVLNVKQIPSWTDRGTIQLRGEVRFPGTYPIRPGETLSQVVERAGGFTQYAYPRAAVFTRETLRAREQRQIDNMIRRLEADVAAAAAAQTGPSGAQAQALGASLVQQLKETRAAGRLVIDLPGVMTAVGDTDIDVLVHDGDLLVVPPRPQEVTVLGEVNFPTSHVFDPDLRGEAYLASSGGLTDRADARRIYIVRANGAVEQARGRRTQIQPGDTIVVPLDADRLPAMVRLMNISQVLYQLGIAAAAWNTLGVL